MIEPNRFFTPTGGGTMSTVGKAGLEDVVVSTSEICFIDGREGKLLYRGFDVDDLAEQSTFEEVVFLLWEGHLPSKKELADHQKALAVGRKIPPKVLAMLRMLPKKTTPMEVLRTGVSALSSLDPDAAQGRREPAHAPQEDAPDGGAPHRRLRAVVLRSRRRRQLARGQRAQGDP